MDHHGSEDRDRDDGAEQGSYAPETPAPQDDYRPSPLFNAEDVAAGAGRGEEHERDVTGEAARFFTPPPERSMPPADRFDTPPGPTSDEPWRRPPATQPPLFVREPWQPVDQPESPYGGTPRRYGPPPAPPTPARPSAWLTWVVPLVVGFLGALIGAGLFAVLDDDTTTVVAAPGTTVVERIVTEIVDNSGDASAVAAAVGRRVIPSIVTVEVSLFDSSNDFTADGSGSGVVLTSDGYIATNEHVVEDAEAVRVIFADGRTYRAEVVGMDARTDLAVLLIQSDPLTAVERGSSMQLTIGDTAVAIGSPLGLDGGPSLTVGVISAFGREVRTGPNPEDRLFGMMQTDAPITRGSSGGALVDGQGRLIGITTAIAVSDVGAEGVGFAIPVELVEKITDELIEFGEARHPFLGISGDDAFETAPDGALIPIGVEVLSVVSDTAAEDAGIATGDIIRTVNGSDVRTMNGLIVALRDYRVGQSVDIGIIRNGSPESITLVLGARPPGQ